MYKKNSKLSLHKNGNMKVKSNNFPPGLISKYIKNLNNLEISSQYANFNHNSRKNIPEDNPYIRHITHNNSNNKNLSFPINSTTIKQNINYKYKENSLLNQKSNLFKKKFETYANKSKKDENSNNYISKENTHSNINIMNNINGIMNKGNLKINIIPKKSNFKFINIKDNNISLNSNKNLGKSISKSKSKSKSKNKRENKSFNNKMNNNINKMIFDKYLKLYKIGEKGFAKKSKTKNVNYLSKKTQNYNISKYSNDANNSDIHKMSSLNMMANIQYKGLKKKNKSTNLLTNNIMQPKNMHNSKTNSNIMITKIETNNNGGNNPKFKNIKNENKLENKDNNENNKNNNKKYLTENRIMYIINQKTGIQKRKNDKNKDKHISSKDLKNESNKIFNTNTNNTNTNANTNNNNSNNFLNLNNYYIDKKPLKDNNENVIYDYKTNNIFSKKTKKNNNINSKNNILNEAIENSDNINIYKNINLNERLKTEYYENSLEAIDKMYEEENNVETNQKSMSFSKHDSFRFLYPEIYIKDDEYFVDNNNNNSNDKKEKELDETESPLKMDTDKVTNENSGVLSFDQVKDIICYYNMNNTDKQSDFLFQKNERQIYDASCKNKYLNFFFGNNKNNDIDKNNNNNININNNINNNELIEDMFSINTNTNFKYPSSSIFSIDTEYSSKMKKKFNKNLVKNI